MIPNPLGGSDNQSIPTPLRGSDPVLVPTPVRGSSDITTGMISDTAPCANEKALVSSIPSMIDFTELPDTSDNTSRTTHENP
jgi:hypothetical protein